MGRHLPLIAACCLPAGLAAASFAAPKPLILINTSPSEPLGVYVRSPLPPAPGRMAAFHTPVSGRAYAEAHLPEIGEGGILKTLVAGAGDEACAETGVLRLNGRRLGAIAARDRAGRDLPQWAGCRVLTDGQYLAFSDRVPNSYDSRYYGPVGESDLIGVFEPLWVRK